MLRNFIFTNKFSIENSKKQIDMYYTMREIFPEIFIKMNPKNPETRKCTKVL